MTRQDYIFHLDQLRKSVTGIVEFDCKYTEDNGNISNPTPLELDRQKKTQKMFADLMVRLYEDAAVSEKVKQEKIMRGDLEQAEITSTDEMAGQVVEDMKKRTAKKGGAK